MMNDRNVSISKGIDWILVWIYIALVSIGIMSIFAATFREGDDIVKTFISLKTDYSKQALFFIIGGFLGIFILLTDSKFFTATANLWYAAGMVLLLLVFPLHTRVKGTESIIKLGFFNLQPAELFKVFVNLALAKYLSQVDTNFTKTKSQLIAAAIAIIPAIISIAQSETGLALVYFSFFLVMFREGLPAVYLIIGFSLAVLVVATLLVEKYTLAIALTVVALIVIYYMKKGIRRHKSLLALIVLTWAVSICVVLFAVPAFFNKVLKPYQVQRIYATVGKDFQVDPSQLSEEDLKKMEDKKKAQSYNVIQSKIAIGSGGLLGKGLLKGTQTRYDFVPEQRTDFIFCTIGEGFGFVGSIVLMAIYFLLLMRVITIAERQRSVFSRCYAYGVASIIFFHLAIN
ncbi:MAG: rod shape-determining protein RodA, partial [Chitinophagaceae bacterium]|nr:rod shape-determining protein RodA [Chitinophagaceae bacterium]